MEIDIKFLQDYRNKLISFEELAKLHKVSRHEFSKIFKEKGFLTNKELNKRLLKHDYFSVINTYEKAYILGYYVADGSCSLRKSTFLKRVCFSCSTKDRELLEFIKHEFNSSNSISDSSKKYLVKNTSYISSEMSSFSVTSENMVDDLVEMGFGFKKTYSELNLPNLEDNLMWKFLLGVFDGDGCFIMYKPKNRNSYNYEFQITSNNLTFLNQIQEFLLKFNITSYIRNDKSAYKISIYKKKDILKIAENFYENIEFGLNRKKIKLKGIPS